MSLFRKILTVSVLYYLPSCVGFVQPATQSTVLELTSTAYGTVFDVEATIGNQSFKLQVDTGSADLWVLGQSWECLNQTLDGAILPQSDCNYGNMPYKQSRTFNEILGVWLGDHYGNGDVTGIVGDEDVRVGSLRIDQQELGIVNKTTSPGDGVNVGLLGLGYPSISAVHPDTYPMNASLLGGRWLYPTFFQRLIEQGVAPFFSLALERTSLNKEVGFGGFLGLGSLPPVPHGVFHSTPVEVTTSFPIELTNNTRQISEWTLSVDSVSIDGCVNSTSFQAVVDSGNALNVLPPSLASEVNGLFEPPGVYKADLQLYQVACNATPPALEIGIASHKFKIDAQDMIWRDGTGTCYSSVMPGFAVDGVVLYFLGDAFLKNVVAVFDVGHTEMRFAERHTLQWQ